MKKRGLSHIEFILAFVLFLTAIGSALYYFNPLPETRVTASSANNFANAMTKKAEVDLTSYRVTFSKPTNFIPPGVTQTCVDTDGGLNYGTLGNVRISPGGGNTWDSCNGNILTEYTCQIIDTPGGRSLAAQANQHTCPNGCSNGACNGDTTWQGYICSDSDGDKGITGTSTIGARGDLIMTSRTGTTLFSDSDSCSQNNLNQLFERDCSGEAYALAFYDCPNGCSNGACTSSSSRPVNFVEITLLKSLQGESVHAIDSDGLSLQASISSQSPQKIEVDTQPLTDPKKLPFFYVYTSKGFDPGQNVNPGNPVAGNLISSGTRKIVAEKILQQITQDSQSLRNVLGVPPNLQLSVQIKYGNTVLQQSTSLGPPASVEIVTSQKHLEILKSDGTIVFGDLTMQLW